jgi:hypothetical protein
VLFSGDEDGLRTLDLLKIMTPPCEKDCYQLSNPDKQQFTQYPEQAKLLDKLFMNKVV